MYHTNQYLYSVYVKLLLLTSLPQLYAATYKPNLNETAGRDIASYHNLTNAELADVLKNRGFRVQEFTGQRPLVRMGDVAYLPEQVMPELAQSRYITMNQRNLWILDGVPKAHYFFDNETDPDKEVFKHAVASWANNTCIQLVQLDDNECTAHIRVPSICVGSYSGCWSLVGNMHPEGGEPQKISLQKGSCHMKGAAHEFGHTLGNQHTMERTDRDDYIIVKYENFELSDSLKDREKYARAEWRHGQRCTDPAKFNLPIPYDYPSVMNYATSDDTDTDKRPVFIAKDSRFQYMPDYVKYGDLTASFYDEYSMNAVYGCIRTWRESCKSSGKQPPKCKNLGYVNKKCKCRCPPAFTGVACETKISSTPFPLMKKVHVVEVSNSQLVDFSKYPMCRDSAESTAHDFMVYQFFEVIVHGRDESQKVTIILPVIEPLDIDYVRMNTQSHFVGTVSMDCEYGVMLLWGVSSNGNLRRECVSTLLNNEPNGAILRGKTHHLDWIYHSPVGHIFMDPNMTIAMMQYKMQVVFEGNPAKLLRIKKVNPNPNMRAAGTAAKAGIGIAVTVILLILAGAGVAWYLRFKAAALVDAENTVGQTGQQEGGADTSAAEQDDDGSDGTNKSSSPEHDS